jgi:hypothetical protein
MEHGAIRRTCKDFGLALTALTGPVEAHRDLFHTRKLSRARIMFSDFQETNSCVSFINTSGSYLYNAISLTFASLPTSVGRSVQGIVHIMSHAMACEDVGHCLAFAPRKKHDKMTPTFAVPPEGNPERNVTRHKCAKCNLGQRRSAILLQSRFCLARNICAATTTSTTKTTSTNHDGLPRQEFSLQSRM